MAAPVSTGEISSVTTFPPPDFAQPEVRRLSRRALRPRAVGRRAPDGFFSTTNLPDLRPHERVDGLRRASRAWIRASCSTRAARSWVREGRRINRGDLVAVGDKEDGTQGIFVQTHLVPHGADPDAFTFMSSEVSREKPIDYAHMARLLIDEKERGGYPDLGDGAGAGPLARAQRHELVHRQRLRRRAPRRQRRRGARHRGVDLRHDARHDQHR